MSGTASITIGMAAEATSASRRLSRSSVTACVRNASKRMGVVPVAGSRSPSPEEGRPPARVVEHRALEEVPQVPAAREVREGRGAEAQRAPQARVAREETPAAHGEDVQAVAGVGEDRGLVPVEELGQHRSHCARDERRSRARRIALRGVEPRELAKPRHRVGPARRREPPRADGGADEVAHARRLREPLAEERDVQAVQPQRLRTARGAGNDRHVGGAKPVFPDGRQRARAGADDDRAQGSSRKMRTSALPPPFA